MAEGVAEEAEDEVAKLKDTVNMLNYAFKGLCGEKLNLRIEITSTSILKAQDVYDYMDFVVKRGAQHLSHEALSRFEDTHKLRRQLDYMKRQMPPSFMQSEFERGY